MSEIFTIFEYRFYDEELESYFNDFFSDNKLSSLFTNEHRTSNITVSYLDAKSVLNPDGKYHQLLKDFADLLNTSKDNKAYEEGVFKVLHGAKTFQKLMNNIKEVIDYIYSIPDNYLFNKWNIVRYNKKIL